MGHSLQFLELFVTEINALFKLLLIWKMSDAYY